MPAAHRASEIGLARNYHAALPVLWDAWTLPEHTARGWGPRGFSLTSHSKDVRAGASWRDTMHGPGGTDDPAIATYPVVESPGRPVYDHGASKSCPPWFRATAGFSEARGWTACFDVLETLLT